MLGLADLEMGRGQHHMHTLLRRILSTGEGGTLLPTP